MMNSYEIKFRYYDRIPETIYLPAKTYAQAFSDAHHFINMYSNCCEIVVNRISKTEMQKRNAQYATQNWRVEVSHLSKDYDDSVLETSTPFQSLWRAQRYYEEMCESGEMCVDDRTKPIRVKLTHYVWGDGWKCNIHELLMANYEGARV